MKAVAERPAVQRGLQRPARGEPARTVETARSMLA
jgi:hypothetical protein